ncbi:MULTISPECIES: hypothetical protein [Brevibacterium]|uniref:ATP synthase protein I2 n=1 Tax=Brevibacterium aurantiacum TaxID=273384 RepID=A0A2A3Z5A9_BREAU|nr:MULTISPECIES: hypothetical protein [Brevibacterium]MDN5772295.1 hypothetical protein [Brevibacterium aurantiacum]PCC46709.1 hypothetical protein CIK64_08850 [Brevibacterium aurantiacum]WCE41796.1 hypothetical protein PGC08_09060 [Brevibacterium sp. BDJS002]SMX81491.1 hypothetical protein BAUR9175_01933 [Brevibacterium aurantiacum]GEB23392.1 hypothetical protein BAU01nite_21250 [Brevibacterium aurantiacum]
MTDESPRQETSVQAAWTRVWRTMLVRGIILVVAVAVLGMGIGYLVSGAEGLNGGAVGGGLAAVFIIITLIIMYAGRNMGLTAIAGFLGIGFLFKAFIFMLVIWRLKDAAWLDGNVAFFTIVVAVIGSSLVEALTVAKARVPYVDPEAN